LNKVFDNKDLERHQWGAMTHSCRFCQKPADLLIVLRPADEPAEAATVRLPVCLHHEPNGYRWASAKRLATVRVTSVSEAAARMAG
jgi:hypothetical protein